MIDEKKIEYAAEKCAERYFGLPKSLQLGAHCFKLGINWFLDNLWHDASEEPENIGKAIILAELHQRGNLIYKSFNLYNEKSSYKAHINDGSLARWLYIDDLLKGGK